MERFVNQHIGRWLHLLEVGAGTGSTTQFILPRLYKYEITYAFTDISHAFLNRARIRFAAFPFVRYEICNIEQSDVGKQKYDVIIASNVIHATADLLTTLCKIRQWLVPGGILILNEITTCQDYMTITFGLIEGWWRSTDSYRTNGPLIAASSWQSLLQEAGFTAVKTHGNANQQVLVAYFDGDHGRPTTATSEPVLVVGAGVTDTDAEKSSEHAINTQALEKKAPSRDQSGAVAVAVTGSVGASQLRWHCLGNGRPLLLLPPLNMSINAWIQQIAVLEGASYAVYVQIYPGHLDNPLEKQSCSFAALVGELRDYIAWHWPGEAVPLVGWSLGGCLALGLACSAPEQVDALVLVNSMARPNEDLLTNVSKLYGELHAYTDHLNVLFKSRQSVTERLSASTSTQVLGHYYQMLSNIDFRNDLPSIMIPSLVVHGQRDPVILASDVEELRQLGNARIVEFKTAGHFIPLLAAHRFNTLLLDFLSICSCNKLQSKTVKPVLRGCKPEPPKIP